MGVVNVVDLCHHGWASSVARAGTFHPRRPSSPPRRRPPECRSSTPGRLRPFSIRRRRPPQALRRTVPPLLLDSALARRRGGRRRPPRPPDLRRLAQLLDDPVRRELAVPELGALVLCDG